MAALFQDLQYGFRLLIRKPAFAVLAILTLAMGIGANTAIFSVVEAVLLRPLPFRSPDQLVQLWQTESAPGSFPLTGQDYLDWREKNHTFEDMAVYGYQTSFNASGSGEPERVTGVEIQPNFFSLMGIQPALGRLFLHGDFVSRQNHEVLLSYAFWSRHFARQSSVLGSALTLDGESYKIVGVMPSWFRMPAGADLWMPIDMLPKALGSRGSHHLRAIGRVKEGVTVEQARADLLVISENLEKQFPDSNDKVHSVVVPLEKQLIGTSGAQLWIVFGAVALVLLIACTNVANLLLARASDRRREIAMRAALGAERRRLVRQLLTESVMLALLGALPGIGLAYLCVSLLTNTQQLPFPQPNPVAVNPVVLAFTFLVSIAAGVLFGMAPAIQISRTSLIDELKSGGKWAPASSSRGHMLRNVLVTSEIALSLALLAAAALLLRTFANLRAVDLGVKAKTVLTAGIRLPEKQYATAEQTGVFCLRLVEGLASTPGIRAAALTTELPLQGGTNGYVTIDGQSNQATEGTLVEATSVTPDYFHALGIPVIRGRAFTSLDVEDAARLMAKLVEVRPDAQPPENLQGATLINQTMARRFWPDQDPVGKSFRRSGVRFQVIGVVGDTKVFGLRQTPIPQAYYPLTMSIGGGSRMFRIVVQTVGQPEHAAAIVRKTVRSIDGGLAVYQVLTMTDVAAANMANDSQQTFLFGTLAALALLLAAVGTYGVMSYSVTQRTGEIGIRMALGAERSTVLWMILREGLLLAFLGIAIGLGGAFAASRLIESLLFGVKSNDPAMLGAASLLMVAVALGACMVPALRATRIEPTIALRHE